MLVVLAVYLVFLINRRTSARVPLGVRMADAWRDLRPAAPTVTRSGAARGDRYAPESGAIALRSIDRSRSS